MDKDICYRVPDVLDSIYNDVVLGLYSSDYRSIKENRIRIAKCNIACDFLINSKNSEDEIVKLVDFPDIIIFRETFKNFLGVYPNEFRKRFSTV